MGISLGIRTPQGAWKESRIKAGGGWGWGGFLPTAAAASHLSTHGVNVSGKSCKSDYRLPLCVVKFDWPNPTYMHLSSRGHRLLSDENQLRKRGKVWYDTNQKRSWSVVNQSLSIKRVSVLGALICAAVHQSPLLQCCCPLSGISSFGRLISHWKLKIRPDLKDAQKDLQCLRRAPCFNHV